MFDVADALVLEWAREAVGDLPVTLVASPGSAAGDAGVSVYLLDAVPRPPARATGAAAPPPTVDLRYVVTTWAPDPAVAHGALGRLYDVPPPGADTEVEQRALPVETWRALGVPPQPALVLRVPVRRERPAAAYRPVLHPMRVRTVERVPIRGSVVGGGAGTPIAGARVLIPSHRLAAETDGRGEFAFAAVPTDPPPAELVVDVKGHLTHVPLAADLAAEPVVVRLDPPQG